MKHLATLVIAFSALTVAPFASAQYKTFCFDVEIVGKGKPVILIPGLTCTGRVWDGTVAQLKSKYKCYVLTLPGFGKQEPITGPYLSHVRDDIIAYVKNNHLNHPAVIGHSLGGFMTYYLAAAEPKLWGPMISVDGLPFLSPVFNPNATAENMKPMAENLGHQMASAPPAQFKAMMRASLTSQITDPKNVDLMDQYCRDSNQADVAEAMKEMLITDLRAQLSPIQSRFLLIGAGQQATTPALRKSLTDIYSAQVRALPGAKVVMDWKARHFVMLDDPEGFYKLVKDFLAVH